MNKLEIAGKTRDLGKPIDWDDSKGICDSLAIRDMEAPHGNVMLSEWKPTAEELKRLNAGASIYLGVTGFSHPPVYLEVGEL